MVNDLVPCKENTTENDKKKTENGCSVPERAQDIHERNTDQ